MNLEKSITEDLQKKINEHLPQAVGEELRKVLEKAKEDSGLVETLQNDKKYLDSCLSEKRKEIDELRGQLSKHQELGKREEAVKKREDALEISDLRLKLQFTQDRQAAIEGLVGTVFRNPQKVVSISETSSTSIPNNTGYSSNASGNKFTTITETDS